MGKYVGNNSLKSLMNIIKQEISENTQTSDQMVNAIQKIIDDNPDRFKGQDANVEGDFLTENGFGKLRYYNGHFQYYDDTTSAWIDTSVSPDNLYIINMIPQSMKYVIGFFDHNINHYKLKFEEPEDTIINNQVASVVEKIIIRRKLGSCPSNENDSELVIEIPRSLFGKYKNEWFVDESLTPNIGDVYYYKAFPTNTVGFINSSSDNESGGITAKDYTLYGCKITQGTESNPDSMIQYIEDNTKFRHAYMDFTSDTFNYGDWKDSFIIEDNKPCMLGYDGKVKYYLDENNFTLKKDGSNSDVSNSDFEGNAMVSFPKIYWKIQDNGDDTANVYVSDKKVDDSFECWAHHDNNGNEIPFVYKAIYKGSLVDGKLRSLSGKLPQNKTTRQQEIDYAAANDINESKIHNITEYSFWALIQILLLLIGKSTNTKERFGHGTNNTYVSSSNIGVSNSGALDKKGMFYGNTDNKTGVKIFGIEHIWGMRYDMLAGIIRDHGITKVKMTYGTEDGSSAEGYNTDGTGYTEIDDSNISGTNGNFISKMKFSSKGLFPIQLNGSSSTYYTDRVYYDNTTVKALACGGAPASKQSPMGILQLGHAGKNETIYNVGASLYCRPSL